MSNQHLLTILDLPEPVTAQEIDAAYSAKKQELEERIKSAPTDGLKEKYTSALKTLITAYKEQAVWPCANH